MIARTILITGASGFIGRALAIRLTGDGHQLILALRRPLPVADPLNSLANATHWLCGDLQHLDPAPWSGEQPEIIIHAAWLAHTRASLAEFAAANITATERVAALAAKLDVATVVHLGSMAAVTSNASERVVDDAIPPAPETAYGHSKLAAERIVADLTSDRRMAITLRPPLVIGPNAPGNWRRLQWLASLPVAPVVIGPARRSYCSLATLVEATAHLCAKDPEPALSGAYCLADPLRLTVSETVQELRAGMGKSRAVLPMPAILLRPAAKLAPLRNSINALTGSLEIDSSRFFENFGFSPQTDLRQVIRDSGTDYTRHHR